MNREQRAQEIARRLTVENTNSEGWRYITLDGIALGRVRREESGPWRGEWRAGWRPLPTQLEAEHGERAELWASEEVADVLAMEAETRERLG